MSFLGSVAERPQQRCCWITHTNERTHDIIRGGLDRSPMYSGVIEGVGPRYCPSIEDKIHRFADKASHQVFIEPEGLTTSELYPNGISTSLPFDVQLALVRSIKGFENAHITRPGYAIEYDYFDPRDLQYSGRSTAPRVTKRQRHRACWPVSTQRWRCRARNPGVRGATKPISACWWMT